MVLWHDKIIQLQDTWVHFSVLAGVYGGGASGSNGVAATSIVGFCGKLLHRLGDYFDQLGFGSVNHSGLLQSCSIYSLVRLNKQRGLWGTCSSVNFCSCAVQLWCGGIWRGSVRRFGLRCACPHVKFLDHASLPGVRDGAWQARNWGGFIQTYCMLTTSLRIFLHQSEQLLPNPRCRQKSCWTPCPKAQRMTSLDGIK